MNSLDINSKQQEIEEKEYLTSLLCKEPTSQELLEFRFALSSLGKALFKHYVSQNEGRCNES